MPLDRKPYKGRYGIKPPTQKSPARNSGRIMPMKSKGKKKSR